MAFLHHNPRRSSRVQLSSSPSTASLSQSAQSTQQSAHSAVDQQDRGQPKDWSIVFPGRARVDASSVYSPAGTASPFISSPDEEVDASNVELTLPHEQDGTGRFTRPSSPYYGADDEDESDGQEEEEEDHSLVPRIIGPPTVDSISEDDSELEGVEMASSAFLSGSEVGRRDSSISHGQRRLSEWENGPGESASSWSWIAPSRQGRGAPSGSRAALPVVFTSGSEGEGEIMEEEAAFEDALASTHLAQSAGLVARAPKRRHRRNGESAKGSKRSNSSAIVTSDLQPSGRRRALVSRRSTTCSYSTRSSSLSKPSEKSRDGGAEGRSDRGDSRVHRLVDVILKRLFRVEDDEVLQAFLRDEGPLKVERPSQSTDASAALAAVGRDEVWSRNERNRKLRQSEGDESDEGGLQGQGLELVKLPARAMHSSQMLASPPRTRLDSHVGEPSLLEALQATVLSSLTVVPSGLSLLLAGTRSVRLVNYLAGQIGPSLTERVRKLIDDAEDDASSIPDDILGVPPSPTTRFRGGSHPAISSRSSTTMTSAS